MGDNDFTAGDPWGLPIEESEELEIEATRPGEEPPPAESDLEELEEERTAPQAATEEETDSEGYGASETEATLDEGAGVGEHEVDSEGGDDWSSSEEGQPPADIHETEDERGHEVGEESAEEAEEEEEFTFKAPSRTPLSQMIAAAQSVVSSVQGDQPEETDDADGLHDMEQTTTDEIADYEEAPAVEPLAEQPEASGYTPHDTAAGDDDLPKEPPSWLIVDAVGSGEPAEPYTAEEPEDGFGAGDDQAFTPEGSAASLAGLASTEPAEAPFAEDRLEMPGEEEPESDQGFGVVDMDSSPGVYSELHNLADQDELAEALLQEAAGAFGQPGEPVASSEEDAVSIDEASARNRDEIDSYAEALATELGTDDTTIEPLQKDIQELPEELGAPPEQRFVDSETSEYLSDAELGDALAGLAEGSTGDRADETDLPVVQEPEEEAAPIGWWSEPSGPVAASIPEVETPSGGSSDEIVADEPVADEPDVAADAPAGEDDQTDASDDALETGGLGQEGAAVIDSPVEWGTRYRDAHQGWVEDDEGRSTWRPIVTSGESVAGWEIDIYLGLVSGDVAADPGSSDTVADDVATAREGALRRMLDEALARGAHAVVGVTFSIQEVTGALLVAASGVAVTLRTPA